MKALGYIFLFYVGFYFYRLAEIHQKNKWVYGFLGIVLFIIGCLSYVLYCRFLSTEAVLVENLLSIGLKAFLSGVILVVLIFKILGYVWNRKKRVQKEDIDKIGK